MHFSRRTELALRRFAKVIAAAVLPVLLASLQQEQIEWRAMAIAAAIAALLAVEKALTYDARRDLSVRRRPRTSVGTGTGAGTGAGTVVPGTRRTPPGPMHD